MVNQRCAGSSYCLAATFTCRHAGSYTWRGLGVWSQLWGMWLLPLSWGFSWRAVIGRSRSYGVAALLVGLTFACHFITGYMALLVLPVHGPSLHGMVQKLAS